MTRPPRVASVRVAAAALALVALAVALVVPGASSAVAAPAGPVQEPVDTTSPTPAPPNLTPPTLSLVERPAWLGPDEAVPFRLGIVGDHTDVTIRFRIHDAVDEADALDRSRTEDVGRVRFRTPAIPVDPGTGDVTQTIAVKHSTTRVADPFTVTLPGPGVYPLVFSLSDADGTTVAEVRTPLLYVGTPADPLVAADMVVLLDVGAPPSLQPDGTRMLAPGVVDELARTAAVLAAHPGAALTTIVTPDTIDALAASDEPAARDVIDALVGRDTLAVPYLPMPVHELRGNDLIGLLPEATSRGAAVLTDALGITPIPGVWDPTGPLDAADATLLGQLGSSRVLVEASPAADGDPLRWRTMGPVRLDGLGPLSGLVVDPDLSDLLAAPMPGGVDAAHFVMARLILASPPPDGPSPGDPSPGDPSPGDPSPGDPSPGDPGTQDRATVLVRPGTLVEGAALDAVLTLASDRLSPVTILGGTTLVTASLATSGDEPPPVVASGPDVDLEPVASDVVAAVADIDTLAATTAGRSSRPDTLRALVLTALATPTSAEVRVALMETVRRRLDASFGAIALVGETDLNLTSRAGTLPVSVANDNDVAVDVLLRIRSDRLRFPRGELLAVTVPAGGTRVDVAVEALATGSVPVFVELWTADDTRMLDARRLDVRSTAISGVGLTISVGALAVLVVWWVRTWRRKRRDGTAGGITADDITVD